MRCETCQGTGVLIMQLGTTVEIHEPCPMCLGQKFQHCCEGECEQPELPPLDYMPIGPVSYKQFLEALEEPTMPTKRKRPRKDKGSK